MVAKSLGSSWSLADVQGGPSVELGDWGAAGSAQAPAGLSGRVWFDWDSSSLYVTAEVTDGNFSEPGYRGEYLAGRQPAGGGDLGGAGVVGRGERRVDGRALRVRGGPDPAGRAGVPVDRSGWGGRRSGADAPVTVTRDDAADTTLYELALPWSDLASAVQPGAGAVFSISALLNDTDSGAREGFLQWGGGIGPDKNVAEFNMAQLMP